MRYSAILFLSFMFSISSIASEHYSAILKSGNDAYKTENYDDAIEDMNNSKKMQIVDDKKFIETIELDINDESNDLNCELNLTGIGPKNQPNSKYYNCTEKVKNN